MDYRRHLPRARAYLAAIGIPPDLTGIRTQLSHYPDPETLNFLRPGEDLTERSSAPTERSGVRSRVWFVRESPAPEK